MLKTPAEVLSESAVGGIRVWGTATCHREPCLGTRTWFLWTSFPGKKKKTNNLPHVCGVPGDSLGPKEDVVIKRQEGLSHVTQEGVSKMPGQGRISGMLHGDHHHPRVCVCVCMCLSVLLFFFHTSTYSFTHTSPKNDMCHLFFLALDWFSEDLLSNTALWWLCCVTLDKAFYLPESPTPQSKSQRPDWIVIEVPSTPEIT